MAIEVLVFIVVTAGCAWGTIVLLQHGGKPIEQLAFAILNGLFVFGILVQCAGYLTGSWDLTVGDLLLRVGVLCAVLIAGNAILAGMMWIARGRARRRTGAQSDIHHTGDDT